MKNNTTSSECALKIKSVLTIFMTLLLLGASMGAYLCNPLNVAKVYDNNIEMEIQVADANIDLSQTTNFERDFNVTSRGSEERTTIIEEQKPKYISIEEIEISRDMDLTERCGVSKEDFIELMSNLRYDTSGFFEENAEIIYDLCEQYELNEIFFCGLIAGESGFNIASNHRNKHNYISMMSGGSMIRYSSDEEGLEEAARLLHERYLSEGGSCYFGNTLYDVQRRFCPNSSTWVNLIYTCMSKIVY